MSAAHGDYPRSNVVVLVRCPKCRCHGPKGEPCVMCELIAFENDPDSSHCETTDREEG